MSHHGDPPDSDAGDGNESFPERPGHESPLWPEDILGPVVINDASSSQQPPENEPDAPVGSNSDGDNDESSEWADDIPQSRYSTAYRHRIPTPTPAPIRIAAPISHARLERELAEAQRIVRTYSPILTESEQAFWFNRVHSENLRRLRIQERFSIRRSIYLAALALYVSYDDFRVWNRLYGPVGAVFVATLAKKSIWKLQAEVLASVIDELQWLSDMPVPIKEKAAVSDGMRIPSTDEYQGVHIPASQPQEKEDKPKSSETPKPQSFHRSSSADSHAPERSILENPQPNPRNNLEERPGSPMSQGNNYVPGPNVQRTAPIPPPEFSGSSLSFKKAVEDESTRIGTSVRHSTYPKFQHSRAKKR